MLIINDLRSSSFTWCLLATIGTLTGRLSCIAANLQHYMHFINTTKYTAVPAFNPWYWNNVKKVSLHYYTPHHKLLSLNYIPGILFYILFYFFLILRCYFHVLLYVFSGSCQYRLNSALESCETGVLTGVIVLAVYVSQINDWLIDWLLILWSVLLFKK